MIIRAKYRSFCNNCKLPVGVGDEVSWPSTYHPTSGVGAPAYGEYSNVDCLACVRLRRPLEPIVWLPVPWEIHDEQVRSATSEEPGNRVALPAARCRIPRHRVAMKSYAEREIFNDEEQATWCDAVDAVNRVSKRWGNELRCHELVRAVASHLAKLNRHVEVVDGKLYAIEHSWLVIPNTGPVRQRAVILDVYCPGRMPQVQLIDAHFVIARGYEPGPDRTDIRYDVLAQLRNEIAKGSQPL